jgi:hypothetical protein
MSKEVCWNLTGKAGLFTGFTRRDTVRCERIIFADDNHGDRTRPVQLAPAKARTHAVGAFSPALGDGMRQAHFEFAMIDRRGLGMDDGAFHPPRRPTSPPSWQSVLLATTGDSGTAALHRSLPPKQHHSAH